jgi:glycosyltransferase involved in cell wall biosynthesis
MLSVIIPTHNHERALVRTLAALVAAAMAGHVRDVIVADGGSTDDTIAVADIAGCRVLANTEPLATRLQKAAAAARADWLVFLRPGVMLDPNWAHAAIRFAEATEREDKAARAAVFRKPPIDGDDRPALVELFLQVRAALARAPNPDQGLVIARRFYDELGGHRDAADPEADLLRRIGHRRIVRLRSDAFPSAE